MSNQVSQTSYGQQSPNFNESSNNLNNSSQVIRSIKTKYFAGGLIIGIIASLIAGLLLNLL